jgi:ubiquinone/menaquinone biosynthesis C-methylase UbiE
MTRALFDDSARPSHRCIQALLQFIKEEEEEQKTMKIHCLATLLLAVAHSEAFLSSSKAAVGSKLFSGASIDEAQTTSNPKEALLELLGRTSESVVRDPVLADPITKEALVIEVPGTLLGGTSSSSRQRVKYQLTSSDNTYQGTSDTFLDLLVQEDDNESQENGNATSTSALLNQAAKSIAPFIPPPIRSALATAGAPMGTSYVPMRDLFTSPAVSFAYERGWRQGFASAGFPGPDTEYQMARDYFAPAVAASNGTNVVVDMSCATGLFTRRFAGADEYDRVIACDYSQSMLTEAKRRIRLDRDLQTLQKTQLDLVRCDVGEIPMQTNSVDAFHAGAAMHCWPDLQAAVSEIHRVLKPGGRYFATTFLSQYFGTLQAAEGGANGPSVQAFQYFESVDQLRKLMEDGGFEHDKIHIEVLGTACVVIRCEK